jgi:hypothetical protein
MDVITQKGLSELVEHSHFPALTIYMPTHRGGADIQSDRIALKNMLRRGEVMLADADVPAETIVWMTNPVWELIANDEFWESREAGLAIFISTGFVKTIRLADVPEPAVTAGERFYLMPLIPMVRKDAKFYLLALNQNNVRLFEGNAVGLKRIEMPATPVGLAEALAHADKQRQLQLHSSGARGAAFHGRGGVEESTKSELLEYFHQVDHGVRAAIGKDQAPLLIAGLDYVTAIYRRANHYPHLVESGVAGNPDAFDLRELHAKAQAVLEPSIRREHEDAVDRLHERLGTGLASTTVAEVLRAANEGRVEALFLAPRRGEQEVAANGRERAEPVSNEELNLAALQTYRSGGRVLAVGPGALGNGASIGATFRY